MKKTLKIIGNVVLWLFVAFSVVITVIVFASQNDSGLPNIFGKSLIAIQSDSMKPEFKHGDLIIDEVLDNETKHTCKIGDVVTYFDDINGDGVENEFNSHRITAVREENGFVYYTTQGDNHEMSLVGEEILSNNVVGRYTGTKIPVVGAVITFLSTSTGFLCCIVIPLLIFFLYELIRFIVILTRMKSKGKLSEEEEAEIRRKAVEEYLRQQGQSATAEADKKAEADKPAEAPQTPGSEDNSSDNK